MENKKLITEIERQIKECCFIITRADNKQELYEFTLDNLQSYIQMRLMAKVFYNKINDPKEFKLHE